MLFLIFSRGHLRSNFGIVCGPVHNIFFFNVHGIYYMLDSLDGASSTFSLPRLRKKPPDRRLLKQSLREHSFFFQLLLQVFSAREKRAKNRTVS